MMSNEETYWLGYLAGMIDGEGSLALHKVLRKGKRQIRKTLKYTPRLEINSNCIEVLELLKHKFGGTIHYGKGHTSRLILQQQKLLPILKKVKLTIKKEQAELLLKSYRYFDARHTWGNRGRPIWAEVELESIHNRIQELNQKYRGVCNKIPVRD